MNGVKLQEENSGGVERESEAHYMQSVRSAYITSLRELSHVPTIYAHAIAPVQRIPHHWPIGYWYQGLGKFIGIRRKGRERGSGSAEAKSLKPR